MMFRGKKIFNASFDIFADNYHSVRPGYPAQVFEDIKGFCDLDETSQLLEIGAGSGIATVELAKFGCRLVGMEPGANLAEIAKKVTAAHPNVEIIEETFEAYETEEKFDALFAFTAFHWLKDGDRFLKTRDLLQPNGSLVLVWNSFFQSDSEVTSEVNEAYRDFLPGVYRDGSGKVNEGVLAKLNGREKELFDNPLFYVFYSRKYLTVYNYDAETYPKLLNTFPKITEIDDEKKKVFFDRVAEVVRRHGKISVPVLTTLIVCKRKDSFFSQMVDS